MKLKNKLVLRTVFYPPVVAETFHRQSFASGQLKDSHGYFFWRSEWCTLSRHPRTHWIPAPVTLFSKFSLLDRCFRALRHEGAFNMYNNEFFFYVKILYRLLGTWVGYRENVSEKQVMGSWKSLILFISKPEYSKRKKGCVADSGYAHVDFTGFLRWYH